MSILGEQNVIIFFQVCFGKLMCKTGHFKSQTNKTTLIVIEFALSPNNFFF